MLTRGIGHFGVQYPLYQYNYLRHGCKEKPIDFAIVSVASIIALDQGLCTEARIVLGAVAPTPVRAFKVEEFLKGKELSEETVAEAASLALAGAKPLSKNGYKLEIAKTLVKSVVQASMHNMSAN